MSALAGDSVSPPLRVPGGRGSLCATVIYKDQGTLGGTRGDPGNPEMVSVQGQRQRWAREAPGAGRSGLCWTSLPTVKSGACRPAFPGALLRPRSPSANWQPTPPPPPPDPAVLPGPCAQRRRPRARSLSGQLCACSPASPGMCARREGHHSAALTRPLGLFVKAAVECGVSSFSFQTRGAPFLARFSNIWEAGSQHHRPATPVAWDGQEVHKRAVSFMRSQRQIPVFESQHHFQ